MQKSDTRLVLRETGASVGPAFVLMVSGDFSASWSQQLGDRVQVLPGRVNLASLGPPVSL